MLKQSFSDALKGIFIGLILSIFFSYLFSPELYLPLSPNSAVGRWMFLHHVHGSLVMLYCALVWGAIGVLFSFEVSSFKRLEPLTGYSEPLPTHVTWVYSSSYFGRLVSSTTRILLLTRCRIHPRLRDHLVGLPSFL